MKIRKWMAGFKYFANILDVYLYLKLLQTLLTGAAIQKSLQNQLLNSKPFLCEYHLVNNLKIPSAGSEEQKSYFMENWYFAERSRSVSVFVLQYIRREKIAQELAKVDSSLYKYLLEKRQRQIYDRLAKLRPPTSSKSSIKFGICRCSVPDLQDAFS